MEHDEINILCPACGAAITPVSGALQKCPACGEQFFVKTSEEETEEDRAARESIEQRLAAEQEKLDIRHIRVIQLERRSLYRQRTWWLVLAWACVGMAGQLIWLAVRNALQHEIGRPVAYSVIAFGLATGSISFFRKARARRREAEQTHLSEPTAPPDFSTLSDGKQIVRDLERLSRGE